MGRRTPASMPGWLRLLFRFTLRLYPPSLRRQYGEEMWAVVERRWMRVASGERPVRGMLRYWARDTLRALPREYARVLRGGGGRRRGSRERHGRRVGKGGTMGWLERWLPDVRLAARTMLRRPTQTVLVALTLGLGIGANAALFTVLDRTLLRPIPFEGGDRMAFLVLSDRERGYTRGPGQDEFDALLEAASGVERVEVFRESGATLATPEGRRAVSTLNVTDGFLSMLGVPALLGRGFQPADARPSSPPVVMMGEAYWRSRHGGDAGVVGETVRLNDSIFTVVGVWPRRAQLRGESPPDFVRVLEEGREIAQGTLTIPVVRIEEGAGFEQVEARLAVPWTGVVEENPYAESWEPRLAQPSVFLGEDTERGLWLVFVGVGLLLVAAVANVGNVLLGRAVQRSEELAVRLALGASRRAVLRIFFVEALLQTTLGVAFALGVAHLLLELLPVFAPAGLIVGGVLVPDPAWYVYAAGLGALCALATTVVPALHLRSPDVRAAMVGQGVVGRRRRRSGSALVAAQVAVTLVLLAGTGLILRSVSNLGRIDTGFDLDRLLITTVRLPSGTYAEPAERRALYDRIEVELEAVPEVVAVSRAGNRPLAYSSTGRVPFLLETGPTAAAGETSYSEGVGSDYFEVMGIPLLAGRTFRPEDEVGEGAARRVIVNDAFRRRNGGDVLGGRLAFEEGDTITYEIVGVVGDVHASGLVQEGESPVQVYFPSFSTDRRFERFVLRTRSGPEAAISGVRERLRALEPDAVLGQTGGMEIIRSATGRHRFFMQLLGAFAAVALLLAATGVYAVATLAVTRREREMGLRIALGADGARVVADVTRRELRPVLLGAVVGLVGAVLVGRAMSGLLHEVTPWDPMSLLAGAGTLVAVAVLACLLPARRAAAANPIETLRAE